MEHKIDDWKDLRNFFSDRGDKKALQVMDILVGYNNDYVSFVCRSIADTAKMLSQKQNEFEAKMIKSMIAEEKENASN